EDQRQRDVDVGNYPPVGRLELEDAYEYEIDDREDRDREDEELVGRALQILTRDVCRGRSALLAHVAVFAERGRAPVRVAAVLSAKLRSCGGPCRAALAARTPEAGRSHAFD